MKRDIENTEDIEKSKDIDFYYKKNRLSQIRGFCLVVQNGCSISKTHENNHIELSTLSKEIRTLERDLGVELFDRSGYNRLKLTKEGELFYKKAVQYVNGIDGLVDSFSKDLEEFRNNNIRIASIENTLEKIMPYLYILKQKYPNINISLYNISIKEAQNKLISKELDLAFYLEDVNEKLSIELEKFKLSDHKSFWVMSKTHPLAIKNDKDITKEDLAKYPFGIFDELVFTKSFNSFISEYNLKSPIDIKNPTTGLLIKMAETGFSISSISEILLTESDKKELELKADYILPQRYFYCFTRKNAIQSKIVNEFLEMVKQNHKKIFH